MLRIMAVSLLFLVVMLSSAALLANTNPVVVISIGGNSTTNIHPVVESTAKKKGYPLDLNKNWAQGKGDVKATEKDAQAIMDKINALVDKNGGQKGKLNLLVVGKSAGGVLAWDLFRLFWGELSEFHRMALVTIDPHGSVAKDKNTGPYCDRQDLWWPNNWSTDHAVLRVYNIFQHEGAGLTGASFPSSHVYENTQVSGSGTDHDSITTCKETKKAVGEAMHYLFERKW